MKIRGAVPTKPTETIALACGEEITVTAPALGAWQRALDVIQPPAPPKRLVTKKGQAPQYLVDESDPAFKASEGKASILQLVYVAWEAMRDADDVTFETPVPQGGADEDFARAIFEEMKAAGIIDRDLLAIARFVGKASGVAEKELEEAVGFSEAV